MLATLKRIVIRSAREAQGGSNRRVPTKLLITTRAKVIRADGTIEDLGIIDRQER